METITKNAEETFELGARIGTSLKGGETIALLGAMGAGKTTLMQGIASGVGIKGRIVSPTFILMRKYVANKFDLYHLDLYRLGENVDNEIRELGIYDLWGKPNSVVVIEWAEKLKEFPKEYIKITIDETKENERRITNETVH